MQLEKLDLTVVLKVQAQLAVQSIDVDELHDEFGGV